MTGREILLAEFAKPHRLAALLAARDAGKLPRHLLDIANELSPPADGKPVPVALAPRVPPPADPNRARPHVSTEAVRAAIRARGGGCGGCGGRK